MSLDLVSRAVSSDGLGGVQSSFEREWWTEWYRYRDLLFFSTKSVEHELPWGFAAGFCVYALRRGFQGC